jgi:hypothetical protein
MLGFTYARVRLDLDPYISARLQWYPVFLPSSAALDSDSLSTIRMIVETN